MSALPPAGWYDDPEHPEQLRYWSGEAWSEHRAPKAAPPVVGGSGLSDIGSWLRQTFTLPAQRWKPIGITVIAGLLISWATLAGLVSVWDDLLYVDDDWSGFSWSRVGISVLIGLAGAIAAVVVSFAQVHQLYNARMGVHPSLPESVLAGLKAVPRAIGWFILLGIAAAIAVVVVAILFVVATALGVLATIALVVAFIWAVVKLAFLIEAFVIPVEGKNPLQASAAVSDGRWWPVFGRLLLLALVIGGIGLAFSLVTAPFAGSFDDSALDRYIVIEEQPDGTDELVLFDMGGIVEELNLTGPASLLTSIPNALINVIAVAATAILYAETHRRRPDGPDPTFPTP